LFGGICRVIGEVDIKILLLLIWIDDEIARAAGIPRISGNAPDVRPGGFEDASEILPMSAVVMRTQSANLDQHGIPGAATPSPRRADVRNLLVIPGVESAVVDLPGALNPGPQVFELWVVEHRDAVGLQIKQTWT